VLEEYASKEQCSVVWFLWTKGIDKDIFCVYNGKCLSSKVIHNWVEKHGKCLIDEEVVEMEVRKWLRQVFYDLGFDAW
jgi:hypothetical protein